MPSFRIPLAFIVLTLLAGCAGPAVHFDYDASTPFATYHTYAWQGVGGSATGRAAAFDNAIENGRVKHAVDAELGAKGFSLQTGSADPDFLVTYYPVGEGHRSPPVRMGLGLGLGPLGLGFSAPVGDRSAEAGIVLVVQSFPTQGVVWKATAEEALQSADSPEEADAEIRTAVHSLLMSFPPRP